MKRQDLLLLSLLMIFSLCACQVREEMYTVSRNDRDFLVDAQAGTIQDGNHTYRYEFSGDSNKYTITITYPDGASFWESKSGNSSFGGWSDDYEETAFADGDTLCEVILAGAPQKGDVGGRTAGILLLLLGGFEIACPRLSWYLSYGWRFQAAQPSAAALVISRVGGVAVVFFGLILLLG